MERLDRLLMASAGLAPGALTFTFRPLWQMDAATRAATALQKAQATAIYAGLGLWPKNVMAGLVAGQLAEDGIYPDAGAAFEAAEPDGSQQPVRDYSPDQPRDPQGRWTEGGGRGSARQSEGSAGESSTAEAPRSLTVHPAINTASSNNSTAHATATGSATSFFGAIGNALGFLNPISRAAAQEIEPEPENRLESEEITEPGAQLRIARYAAARNALRAIDPENRSLETLSAPDYVPTEGEIAYIEAAAEAASLKRVCDSVFPNGEPIGQARYGTKARDLPGNLDDAKSYFDYLSAGGVSDPIPNNDALRTRLPGQAGYIVLRPVTSTLNSPALQVNVQGKPALKLHYRE